MHVRVRELDRWPPRAHGVSQRAKRLPSPEEAILVKTIFCCDFSITFSCGFGGDLFVYDYETDGPATAHELKRIVEANIGKSLASIGEMELQAP